VVGNSYLLRQATSAVTEDRNPQHILRIPDEAVVTVVKRYRQNRHDMLTVEWSHTKLSIFAVDLEERGELVTDLSIALNRFHVESAKALPLFAWRQESLTVHNQE
jgi:hypothetical protein